MEKNEAQRKQINEADYIDIFVYIRAYLRLARRYFLLVCPIIVCLTAGMNMLSRVGVKEQYTAEATIVVGITLSDDFSYNYNLSNMRDDYVDRMSESLQSVLKSEYMYYLLEEELGRRIPGDISWENVYGTNMGRITAVSDAMENAVQLRDAIITYLPKALFTTLGDIEIKVLGTSERTEVLHEELTSPLIWVGAGVFGGIFAYIGIVFLISLWSHDIETSEDMAKITDLPCLGSIPKSRKFSLGKKQHHIRTSKINEEYNRSSSEFRKQLEDAIERHQVKTLLFTGGFKKRGQTELLNKLNGDWISQGRKVSFMNMDLLNASKTTVQIQEELNKQIEEALKESDLIIIDGPGYEQTVELLTIADCVDGIVYLVKAGYDQLESTEEAIGTLRFTNAEFLGYVITA